MFLLLPYKCFMISLPRCFIALLKGCLILPITRYLCVSPPGIFVFLFTSRGFKQDCPDGNLSKEKILEMYSMILPAGNAKVVAFLIIFVKIILLIHVMKGEARKNSIRLYTCFIVWKKEKVTRCYLKLLIVICSGTCGS